MKFIIVGLGNPGEEYINTRHNAGRLVVEAFADEFNFPLWEKSTNAKTLYSNEKMGKHSVELLLPETFMNKTGFSVGYAQKKHKIKSENVIVVYDDIDLPFGKIRLAYGRGSGGHKGVESVIKALKTKDFVRVRIGVAPTTSSGKIKKPSGEKKVYDFLLGDFSKKEAEQLKEVFKTTTKALESIIVDGKEKAMNLFN